MALSHEEAQLGDASSHQRGVRLSRSAEAAVDAESTVKFGKKLTVGDIERYAALLRANPLFRPGFSEIVDLSEVEEFDPEADEFLKLADKIDPFSIDAKRAFVARNSDPEEHQDLRFRRRGRAVDQGVGSGAVPAAVVGVSPPACQLPSRCCAVLGQSSHCFSFGRS